MLPLMLLLCGIRLTYLYGLVNAVLCSGTVSTEIPSPCALTVSGLSAILRPYVLDNRVLLFG
jgi:hypothetical protein